jgi:PAS domain S-box-containing protein
MENIAMRSRSQNGGQEALKDGSDAISSLLSAIVESSHDAIVSKTLEGIIVSWNPAAERMFGYTAAEAIGQSIRMIIPSELQAEEDYVLNQIRHGEKVDHFETIRQTKDGRRLDISLTVSPVRNSQGAVIGASKIARDITQRKRLESRLAAIVSSSDDAIVSKTLDSTIISWNSAAERMFGYTAAEAIGQSIRLIIPPELQAEEDYILNQICRGEKVDHFETIRQTKDGRRLDISLTVSPIRNSLGTVVGASKIARDITQKKALEREREVAQQRLAEALAARDTFIAVAAHELRNPLNVLVLLGQLMDRTPARTGALDVRKLAEKSRAQLARLSSLVDRLLDVTRIRSGSFDLYLENFELDSLIKEVTSRFAVQEPAMPITLRLQPHIEGMWDRLRIDQVITNLISNAVEYGMKRPIEISASADGEQASIIVRDQGTGISPEDLERIFERFERADPNSRTNGLGLGLWITKKIVEAHGGTVLAESELDKGSTFIVRLPLRTD